MDILFIFARPVPYNSVSVREKPCGGTEKAVIFLGEALQKLGHGVTWITTPEELRAYSGAPDVVVTQIAELFQRFPKARKVWWTHHFTDQPVIQANLAFARAYADTVVTLSQCHHNDFLSHARLNSVVIGHGVWLDEVQTAPKDPYRLIYASTPFRGLERVPALFREIKAREPRATIAIASSMRTYGDTESDEQYQGLFRELASIDGVELLGSLNQEQLYAEYARASYFYYPNSWQESYCLALDEALAHGCIPIIPDIGALPERAEPSSDFIDLFKKNISFKRPCDWFIIANTWNKEILNAPPQDSLQNPGVKV